MLPITQPVPASRPARRVATACAAASVLLGGCMAVGPDYRAPQPSLPVAFANRVVVAAPEGAQPSDAGQPPAAAATPDARTVELVHWWQGFGDAQLAAFIEAAQQANPTIGQAVARVRQARAALVAAGAPAALRVDATAGGSRATQFFFTQAGPTILPVTVLQAGLDASWEIDLFGRVLRGQRAAAAQAESIERSWHDARATVAAEVARAYVQARACRSRTDALRRQSGSVGEALRIDQLRLSAGRAAAADAAQTRASAAEALARLADAQSRCVAAEASLAELTGLDVEQVRARLAGLPLQMPSFAGLPGEVLPAEVLRQRPDVAAAERRLAAASERIGEAAAAQYPSFSITGAFTLNRLSALGNNFRYRSWSLAPGLRLPLLDGSRRRAQVEQREAEYDEAYEAWRAQVARAVAETETALGQLAASLDRVDADEDAVRQYSIAFAAEQARNKAGRTSVLELERARRALLNAESAAIEARETLAIGWVTLYKALGGGWDAQQVAASR